MPRLTRSQVASRVLCGAFLLLIVLCPLAAPAPAGAQAEVARPSPEKRLAGQPVRFRSVLLGAVMGGAHAAVAIDPRGPSPIADEPLMLLGIVTGAGFGALADALPGEVALSFGWGAVRIGALRDELAVRGERRRSMGARALETRLSLLGSLDGRWAFGPVVGMVSHGFEQVEQETRCGGLFGCITGDFVTSHSHLQVLNVGVAARLRPGGPAGNAYTMVGGGVGAVRLDSEIGQGSGASPFLEAGAGLSRSRGLVRAFEAGLRLQRADPGPAAVDLSGAFLRLVLAYGPPAAWGPPT